jgi:hypothetical protein
MHLKALPAKDQKLYREWSNPQKWKKVKGAITQDTRE